ncbi:MAG: hypothetical protein AAF958_19160 [Planctomycetota bacterium]
MRSFCFVTATTLMLAILVTRATPAGAESPTREAIDTINALEKLGANHQQVQAAADQLRTLDSKSLPRLFDAMKSASPLAKNWFRGIAADIARESGMPKSSELMAYIVDRTRNPDGRALALTMLMDVDAEAAEEVIAGALNDPSLLIRQRAVDAAIAKANTLESDEDKIEQLRTTLAAARHPRQLEKLVRMLRDLKADVTIADALQMWTRWQAIAPFDNRNEKGYAIAYPPEKQFVAGSGVDFDAKFDGKAGPVVWKIVEGDLESGYVDLAKAYNKEKGAIVYVTGTIDSISTVPAQVRLTTKNANKIWLNGKEIGANEVYHSGSVLDQYICDCELVEGENRFLLKLCQNEQEEGWAQEYAFQFRLTDPAGKPITAPRDAIASEEESQGSHSADD